MIDTIVLTLSKDMFEISYPNNFTPFAQLVFSHRVMHTKQNPTKRELRNGMYKPRLTLFNRMTAQGSFETSLKIELSLPKLLFGNNFDELRYKDFIPLIQKLIESLKTMGVITTAYTIAQAPVYAIHYAKNIPLTDGSTPYHFINQIKQANIKMSLDVNQTDYRNDGHSYKWHCNSYEVIFYDKIKDLAKAKQSNKRSLEKDSNLPPNILKKLKTLRQAQGKRQFFEILRMEVRLNKRQKIKQLFGKLGIKNDFTFKKLFKPAIAKKVLLHYLDELESKRPSFLDYKAIHDKVLLADLAFHNPKASPKKLLHLFGLKKVLEIMSPRELSGIFVRYNKRNWNRFITDVYTIKLPITQGPFGIIRKQIMKFKPLKIAKIQEDMPNYH